MSTQTAPHDRFDEERSDAAPAARTQYRVLTPILRYDRRGGRPDSKPKTFWHHIGMAWQNPPTTDRAGNIRAGSISIKLNSLPLTSELVLFVDEGRPDDKSDVGDDQT
jgi:hypothetical protein